jgi:acyl-CoA synthetase (AMP-forming)/AMP-acid ligase II
MNFTSVLAQHFHEHPDRVAMYLQQNKRDDTPITYRRLLSGAAAFARRLLHANVRAGDVVVIILQHGESLVFAFWGAILHGAIPSILPPLTEKLSPQKYRKDLASLIGVTQPKAIVTFGEFEGEVRQAVAESQRHAHVIIGDLPDFAEPEFDSLQGIHQSDSEVVLLQHSSGSTGLQKGVALSHRAVFNQLNAYAEALKLTNDDVIASWLPLYHDMGLIASFVLPMLRGVPVVMMSPFDWVRAPAKLFHAITKYHATLSWLPNFAYNFSASRTRERDLEGVDLSTVRAFINCSEPCYRHSHDVFYDKFKHYGLRENALQTCYAMAENVFAVTQSAARALSSVAREDELHLSSGVPLPNVELRILDENRIEVIGGGLGEIAIKSDCMLSGYFHRDDLNDLAFHDGFFLTGDLGYLRDGELFVTGRKKDIIIVGGKNVYPNDLEQLASEVNGVHAGRVVAFGVYDEETGTEEVVVLAEADAQDEIAQQKIADEVRAHITKNSDVAVRVVKIVDPKWLIKTSSGKIARSANKEKYIAQND